MLEDALWESSFSSNLNDEYINNLNTDFFFNKQDNLYNKHSRQNSNNANISPRLSNSKIVFESPIFNEISVSALNNTSTKNFKIFSNEINNDSFNKTYNKFSTRFFN